MSAAAATERAIPPAGTSDAATPGATTTRRLARDLLRRAAAALPRLAVDERAASLAALDAFLAAPSPSRHLAAARLLAAGARAAARDRLGRGLAERRLVEARAALPRVAGLDPSLAAELSHVAADDPRAALRLEALAALVEAEHLLAAGVAALTAERRRQLERPAPPPPPRRGVARRAAAR